ncbi:MAG: hypothetical protein NT116_02545 [Candidatus Parcubacteria bacterium]|nr:hypothetical protein [Candidatus Parcubacteria bacterium]
MSVIEIQPLDVAQDLDKLIEQMKEKQKDLETFDDQCVRNLGIHYNQLENVRNKEDIERSRSKFYKRQSIYLDRIKEEGITK